MWFTYGGGYQQKGRNGFLLFPLSLTMSPRVATFGTLTPWISCPYSRTFRAMMLEIDKSVSFGLHSEISVPSYHF